ncbi:AAA family ATPase [Vibrio minamisatsumaniensis]|uniref:AAA family ATPase n=1 Tax=Vibrio minamisatsumaniensis TaxID=2910243 RepID=UPI003D21B10C
MMAVVKQQLWRDFLTRWPREKLNDLTLEQYVSVNDDDTFTYWLETKTRELGSIQGNTSAKFGIYKRNGEGKAQSGIGHGPVYTWRNRYGNNESMVFDYVKNVLIQVAQAAYEGDLDKIDLIDFAPLVKWKIAFLYQNQEKPVLINTFSKPMLEVLTSSNNKVSFPQMYQQLILEKGQQDLLEFGDVCWQRAERKHKEIIQRTIFEQFSHIELFNRGLEQWPLETIDAFCSLISKANTHKLDVFTTSMATGAMIRIGRKELGSAKAEQVFATFEPTLKKINFELRYEHRDGYECAEVSDALYQRICKSKTLAQFAKQYSIKRKAHWPKSYRDDNESDVEYDEYQIAEAREKYAMQNQPPLNQILYGPPGTGKTYHTIEAAVKAAEPEFSWETRGELKAKYDELVTAKRIRFVTFHQSYGYEDFVEGLKAKTTVDKSIEYVVENGVFKSISEAASISLPQADSGINEFGRVWKISIEGTYKNEAKTYCLKHNIAAIGWGDTGDLSSSERNEYFKAEGSNNQISLTNFSQEIAVGDLILCIDSNTSVEAVGVVRGDYFYSEHGLPSRADFQHHLPVDWIAKDFSIDFKQLNGNTQFHVPTCWNVERLSVNGVLQYLAAHGIKFNVNSNSTPSNYVLIIDEINRGNISKIFGELITLIEPSKRMSVDKKGEDESIQIKLPHSEPLFSVPDNLYLIGTMNTADRSIAMMDTALRRRFDFVEMMPNPELLKDTVVNGIDLAELLKVINQRIEILYDREHTLGHAFFMPVKALVDAGEQEEAFNALVSVFKNKIIPLLEEYFVEDWDKIRLVLADNQKPEHLQFVEENVQKTEALTRLFGKGHQLDQYGQSVVKYTLAMDNADVWSDAHAYTGIYQTVVNQSDSSPE